ncbi:MAG TPA: patatin-like phospholipase family protein, partial [Dongiaceae bacterium]
MSGEDPALSLSRVLVDECVEHFSETLPDDIAAGSGDSPEYMAKVYAYLNGRDRWALCLSGGGIRSATFGLGLLQGLARKNLLARFDYLSTVSGGGYIGAWLSAWAHRGKPGGGAVGIDAV